MRKPIQLPLNLGEYVLVSKPVYDAFKAAVENKCDKRARYITSDEVKCSHCGIVWGIDEPRPPCDSTQIETEGGPR